MCRVRHDWATFQCRFADGESRSNIFRDVVREEILRRGEAANVLDIGCGYGFDGDDNLIASIAEASSTLIGVEPDENVAVPPQFDTVYRCRMENAPLKAGFIDVAFAVMVLEHIGQPDLFWKSLWTALRRGGVFWGLTVDSRHYFVAISRLFAGLGIKKWYLKRVAHPPKEWLSVRSDRSDGLHRPHGNSMIYRSYPTFYRANSPRRIRMQTRRFRRCEFFSLQRAGQLNPYLPRLLLGLGTLVDRLQIRLGLPAPFLLVRLEK